MMKKFFAVVLLFTALHYSALAQKGEGYSTAAGLGIDFGSNFSTLVGISAKHFFSEHNVGQGELQFGTGVIAIGIEYLYHATIPNADGLKWYAGLGPQFAIGTGEGSTTDVLIRPMVGLDYKISQVPLAFSFDWRPAFVLTHGTGFDAARFGLGFRYAF